MGEMCRMAMCAPRGLGCMWRVYKSCEQSPFYMDWEWTHRYTCLHADSDFIEVSNSVHSLCKPHLGGTLAAFFAQRYTLVSDWGSMPSEPMRYHTVSTKHVL